MPNFKELDLPFEDTVMHCWEGGAGEKSIIFMHGSGAGAQTMSNFKAVLEPLSQRFRVLATDLIGYGQSGLRKREPYFDIDMWVRQLDVLLDRAGSRPAILVGHSLSGALVLKKAASGDKRVAGVVCTAPFGISYVVKPPAREWVLPTTTGELEAQVKQTVYDPSFVDREEIANRWATISQPGYREYFSKMFSERRQHYIDLTAVSTEDLRRIECPVLLMHGADDKSFTAADTSLPLSRQIANCDVAIFSKCGHSVALEKSREFIGLVETYFGSEIVADP